MQLSGQVEWQQPEPAIKQLRDLPDHDLVILDCDETLFLRNSTEEYLNCLRPKILGAFCLFVLELMHPWDFLPRSVRGSESKDWFRVVAATLLFPWTWFIWQHRAASLAAEHENRRLVEALAVHPKARIILATHGFTFIVKPLSRHFSLPIEKIIGCRFLRGIFDRQKNKEEMAREKIPEERIQNAVVVTDSTADLAVLEIARHPLLVQWPEARYTPALTDAYLPLRYLECVKRPGQRYIRWMIVEIQLVTLILAYSWLAPMPLLHIAGIVLLLISFWCVYETGYYENDLVAEAYEEKPALSPAYQQNQFRMSPYQPWLVAALLAFPGVVLTQVSYILSWDLSGGSAALAEQFSLNHAGITYAGWMGLLICTRLLFAAYNYLDEHTRVWIFPCLQVLKYFIFAVVARTSFAGAALLTAQVFSDWIPYLVYRCGGQRKNFPEHLFKTTIFLFVLAAGLLAERQTEIFWNWQTLAIFAWLLLHSKNQLAEVIKRAHPIWRQ